MDAGILSLIASLGAGCGILGASLRWNWWRFPKKGIPVLMYHKIGQAPRNSRLKSLWVTPERFAWQLAELRRRGYCSVTFADLAAGRLPDKPVLITFDDGYKNQYTQAYPILKRFAMRAVIYVVTDTVGRDNFWHDPATEQRLPMLSKEEILEMRAGGMEFGSHTLSHRRMAFLSWLEVERELRESKKWLESLLGETVLSFAFPYGNGENEPQLIQAVYDAGYRWVLGIHGGLWDPKQKFGEDPKTALNGGSPAPAARLRALPRIFVRGDDAKLDFQIQLRSGKSRV